MDASNTAPQPQIQYGMLQIYEQTVLKRRPLKRNAIHGLLKGTLKTFLEGNGIVLPPSYTKDVLTTMIGDLMESEENANQNTIHTSSSSSSTTAGPSTSTSSAVGLSSSVSFAAGPSASTSFDAGLSTSTKAVPKAGSSALASFAPDLIPTPTHVKTEVLGHQNKFLPTTLDEATTSNHSSSNSSLMEDSIYYSSEEDMGLPKMPEQPLMLEPCNAIYLQFTNDYEEGWDMPPPCSCVVSVKNLTEHMSLPKSSLEVLGSMTQAPIGELKDFLEAFGEQSTGSGCRVHLLLQLRDLLEQEAKTVPAAFPGNAASTSLSSTTVALAGASSSVHSSAERKRKYAVGPGLPPTASASSSKLSKPSSTVTSGSYLNTGPMKVTSVPSSVANKPPAPKPFKSVVTKPKPSATNTFFPTKTSSFSKPDLHGQPVMTSVTSTGYYVATAMAAPTHFFGTNSTSGKGRGSTAKSKGTPRAAPGRASATQTSEQKVDPVIRQQQVTQNQLMSQAFGQMMAQQMGNWGISLPTAPAAAGVAPRPALQEENPEKECVICVVEERQVAFVPCGHAVCCKTCSLKLKDCPVCRKKIKSRLTIFFS